MKHFMLVYELAADYLERRQTYRNEHLSLAWAANERGEMVLAGAANSPVDTAWLLFQGDTDEAAERFAAADPYVRNGLVKRWSVREWTTVIGKDAATPMRPQPFNSPIASV